MSQSCYLTASQMMKSMRLISAFPVVRCHRSLHSRLCCNNPRPAHLSSICRHSQNSSINLKNPSKLHQTMLNLDGNGKYGTSAFVGQSNLYAEDKPPSEEEVLNQLQGLLKRAIGKVGVEISSEAQIMKDTSLGKRRSETNIHDFEAKFPDSNLLALDRSLNSSMGASNVAAQTNELRMISLLAFQMMLHPKVFITRKILSQYVALQTALNRPQTFPRVFDLFASKALPALDLNQRDSRLPNFDSSKAAIPLEVAKHALESAIKSKDLPLCLSIVTTTVGTKAYRRAKFMRKGLLPTLLLTLSPVVAISLGQVFAAYAVRLDPWFATWCSALCFMTYFGMVATSGYVAAGTAFHNIDRVSWRVGTPLHQRYFREEERELVDRIVKAWGFQENHKRGQETGATWESLREWILERSMELDNPELMEGME